MWQMGMKLKLFNAPLILKKNGNFSEIKFLLIVKLLNKLTFYSKDKASTMSIYILWSTSHEYSGAA